MSTPSSTISPACWQPAAAGGAYAGGLTLLALTFWRGWIGRPFAVPHLIYVQRPIPHLLAGLLALLVGYLLHRGYRNDAKAWGRLAGKGALLGVGLGLSFLVGEVGYRGLLWQAKQQNSLAHLKQARESGKPIRVHSTHPLAAIVELSPNPVLGYELQPHLNMTFGHRSLRTNADGMRENRDYATGRLSNGVRIVGIGDSGMFGWNCDQSQAYMEVLEDRLQAGSPSTHFEVLNLAVPGYNTKLEVECLKTKGLKYEPDVVVVGWCANDYDAPFFKIEEGAFSRRDVSFLYSLLFNRDHLAALIGGQVCRAVRPQGEKDDDKALHASRRGAPETHEVEAALRDLVQLQQQHSFHLLVFGPMDAQVIDLCRGLGIPYFDTKEKVDARAYPEEWAVHLMHPRPEGHHVLGERLGRELDRLGWLKPRAHS